VNRSLKLLAPLFAALTVAACNAGGSSNVPGTSSQNAQSHVRAAMPEWQSKGLAKAACPLVPGRPSCLALIQSKSGINPNVAGWAPSDFQTLYNLPSSTNGSGQVVAIVDAYDNPNVATDLAQYR